ncbi:unnamed protein product [Camellia sinensis]
MVIFYPVPFHVYLHHVETWESNFGKFECLLICDGSNNFQKIVADDQEGGIKLYCLPFKNYFSLQHRKSFLKARIRISCLLICDGSNNVKKIVADDQEGDIKLYCLPFKNYFSLQHRK